MKFFSLVAVTATVLSATGNAAPIIPISGAPGVESPITHPISHIHTIPVHVVANNYKRSPSPKGGRMGFSTGHGGSHTGGGRNSGSRPGGSYPSSSFTKKIFGRGWPLGRHGSKVTHHSSFGSKVVGGMAAVGGAGAAVGGLSSLGAAFVHHKEGKDQRKFQGEQNQQTQQPRN